RGLVRRPRDGWRRRVLWYARRISQGGRCEHWTATLQVQDPIWHCRKRNDIREPRKTVCRRPLGRWWVGRYRPRGGPERSVRRVRCSRRIRSAAQLYIARRSTHRVRAAVSSRTGPAVPTFARASNCSLFSTLSKPSGRKVCSGSKADLKQRMFVFALSPESGHSPTQRRRPFSAKSRRSFLHAVATI